MKMFLQTKVVIVLLLSIAVAAGIMSGCTSETGDRTGNTTRSSDGGSDGGRDDRRDDRRSQAKLKCELPSCSGSNCCDKEDSDGDLDEDCEDWCKKDLSLSGTAYDRCLALDKVVVEDDLLFLFDDRLSRPEFEELERLKSQDVEIICAAVKHLDSDLLSDKVDKYGSTDAKAMLEWLATDDTVLEIFDNADDDDGLKMIIALLEKLGTGTGDSGVLSGLGQDVSEDRDDDNVLELALSSSNDNLVDYLHDEIIQHEDEICSESNYPAPDTNVSIPGGSGNYSQPENHFRFEACVLAAYCNIAPSDSDEDDKFRKEIADFVNHSSIVNFIKRSAEDGGLDIVGTEADHAGDPPDYYNLDEDDAEEWTYKACTNLKYFWSSTLFDLGS